MRWGYKALFFMLAVNLASWLVAQLPVYQYEQPLTPFNITQFGSELNKTNSIIESWEWGGGSYIGDVMSALRFFWNIFRAIIWGLPDTLTALNAPAEVKTIVGILWSTYWTLWILWFIGGRDIEGG